MNNGRMDVEAYGSATIQTTDTADFNRMFSDPELAARGIPAMLLGEEENNPQKGAIYAVGMGGEHRGHALTFGRTRGGKGVSSIIPALLTYKGSMVVIDPKGENAWITAQRRRDMGHRVVVLDPWNEVYRRFGSKAGAVEVVTKFNPLSALDPNDADFVDDVAGIAEALILPAGHDPHWSDSARELTAGLIAAQVQHTPGEASMRSVRKALRAPIDILRAIVDKVVKDYPDTVGANKLAAIVEGKDGNEKELSSIRSTARTQTAFLDSTRLLDSMETDYAPFTMRDLATEKVTLYLVLPVDRLSTHGRWLRLLLTLAIKAISKAEAPPMIPVVFMLDELGTISPGNGLSMLEQSYGLMAGLGIRIWAFLQDLPQLKRDYPNSWETFISNSSVIQLLNVADTTTAEYFSKFLGNGTVNARTGNWSFKHKRFVEGDSHYNRTVKMLVDNLISERRYGQDLALETAHQIASTGGGHLENSMLLKNVHRWLQEAGVTHNGYQVWEEDTQPMSRPVFFPWEIVEADPTKCIIIMPGLRNLQLKRFIYYTDPWLTKWARPDPNRPGYQRPPVSLLATPSPPSA